jgi:hypothetical protein
MGMIVLLAEKEVSMIDSMLQNYQIAGFGDHSLDGHSVVASAVGIDQHDSQFYLDFSRIGSDALGRTATGFDVDFSVKHCLQVGRR